MLFALFCLFPFHVHYVSFLYPGENRPEKRTNGQDARKGISKINMAKAAVMKYNVCTIEAIIAATIGMAHREKEDKAAANMRFTERYGD